MQEKQHSFYEFIGANFRGNQQPKREKEGNDFTFSGKTFMSGSKSSKLSNDPQRVARVAGNSRVLTKEGEEELQSRIAALNKSAKEIITARGAQGVIIPMQAIKVAEVDRSRFIIE